MKRRNAAEPRDLKLRVLRGGESEMVLLSFTPEGREALTQAEREVAIGVARGMSNDEIARLRGVSERTVANQVASVLKKFGVASRAELAARFGISAVLGTQ